LFLSPALLCSSSRTVGFPRRSWASIFNSDNPMSPISIAPHNHNAIHERCLSRTSGRVLIYQVRSMRHHAFHRRKTFCAIVPGAAVSHALSRKARGRIHGNSGRLHLGPEVVCNKNRFGKDMVIARSRSPVESGRLIRGPQARKGPISVADVGPGQGLSSRFGWLTPAQVGRIRVKPAGWVRTGKPWAAGLRWD